MRGRQRAWIPAWGGAVALAAVLYGQAPTAKPASVFEALAGGGADGARWQKLFAGAPAAKAQAEAELAAAGRVATPAFDFEQVEAAWMQGHDREGLQAAVKLLDSAPDDVATELAFSQLGPAIGNRGRDYLEAAPHLRQALERPLGDPVTAFVLGRDLLAAVGAPGVDLTPAQAQALAGRAANWELWGPFGRTTNLDFDHSFGVESGPVSSAPDGLGGTRTPLPFHLGTNGVVEFPADWHAGIVYGVTWLHATAAERVLLRMETADSFAVTINGVEVLRNDRRARYSGNGADAAIELGAGWNRVVVKLGGDGGAAYDFMARRADGGPLETAAAAPAGAAPAAAPKPDSAPATLARWAEARRAAGADPLTEWADGAGRVLADDGENARGELGQATSASPNAALAWLALADAYAALPDAGDSWTASQLQTTLAQALKAAPEARRAHERLGEILLSQGKPTEAAGEYAQCANQGYSDCDWAAFRLAARRGWMPEARAALTHALAQDGSNWSALAEAMDFYSAAGDAAATGQWEKTLRADPRAAAALGRFELRHGHPAEAATLLAEAMRAEPSAPGVRIGYLTALLQTGGAEMESAAKKALVDFPADGQVASLAAELELRSDSAAGAATLRELDYGRDGLRREADFLARDQFWQPWYHAATDVIRDAPDKAQYPNASAILVLDQMVDRVNPDSTRDAYIHQVFRVLDAQGIQMHGDISIPEGSDLITLRTIKQDGTMLLPEKLENLSSISMPGLEPGDFVETEYVMHTAANPAVAETMDNNVFFVFNSSKEPYHFSDYITLVPDGYPIAVETHLFPEPPEVRHADGWTSSEWLIQKTRVLIPEPAMPPEQELVPRVWISSKMSWEEIGNYLADRSFDVRHVTVEMQRQADLTTAGKSGDPEKADALFAWVAANIQPGDGPMLAPARQAFTDRSGNRISVFLGLLNAAHVPYQIVMARNVTDQSSTGIPNLSEFEYPLVHVGGALPPVEAAPAASGSGWYDLNSGFATLGYIAAPVRGADAMVAGGNGATMFTRVPAFDSDLDGLALNVTGRVAGDGTAALHLTLEFRGPNGEQIREALQNQPASRLPQIYQQLLLENYPNATASNGQVENMNDKTKSLIIEMDAAAPDFVHLENGNWDLAHLAGSADLLARYAQLPFRQYPLLITGDTFEQVHVQLALPANFAPGTLPAAANLSNDFGRFTSSFTFQGGQLDFTRRLFLKANVIAPERYDDFRAFGEAIDNQDRLRLNGTAAGGNE